MITQNDDDPYLDLTSSKGHSYQRFIIFGTLLDVAVEGEFDQFGLSKVATVPGFSGFDCYLFRQGSFFMVVISHKTPLY